MLETKTGTPVPPGHADAIHCRICGAGPVRELGEVEFYVGYRWPIYDCAACGCRYTLHDDAAYEAMYSETNSCYNRYIVNADRCKALFDRGDLAGLKAELFHSSRYQYIIEKVSSEPMGGRLLEIGCSRGHLTSYFLLEGRSITGVDVSPTAISAAAKSFGGRFVLAGDPIIEAQAPYDVIYHVGTIGCVIDPIGMTKSLLALLKPGGRLLFNAPNRDSFTFPDQLWIDSAPPPDLVTLFAPGFWTKHLGADAQVHEQLELHTPAQSLQLRLRRLRQRHWRKPQPIPLRESNSPPRSSARLGARLWARLERLVVRLAHAAKLDRFVRPRPTEFGIFVEMTKN